MSNYRIIMRTCDEYINALRPTMWLFNKYYGRDFRVLVGGFTPPPFPMESNFEFFRIGDARDYKVNQWSDATIQMLTAIDDDAFVFMLDDWWINGAVAHAGIQGCIDEARANQNVLRIDICAERLYENQNVWKLTEDEIYYKRLGHCTLVKSRWDTPYQLALSASVFRRDVLLDNLRPGWSPWETEIIGTNLMRARHAENAPLVLGTTLPLMTYANGYKQDPEKTAKGKRGKDALRIDTYDLRRDDLTELMEWGLL